MMKQKRPHDSQIVRVTEKQVESWWVLLQISTRPRLTRRFKLYVTCFFWVFFQMLNLFFFCPLQFPPKRSGPSLGFICNCEVHKVNEYLSYITNSLTSLAMRSLYDFMVQLQIDLRRNVSSQKNLIADKIWTL